MAVVCGLIFAGAFVFGPERGLVSQFRRRSAQRVEFAARLLAVHLLHHEGTAREGVECALSNLDVHLGWSESAVGRAVAFSVARGLTIEEGPVLHLTEAGRRFAEDLTAGVA